MKKLVLLKRKPIHKGETMDYEIHIGRINQAKNLFLSTKDRDFTERLIAGFNTTLDFPLHKLKGNDKHKLLSIAFYGIYHAEPHLIKEAIPKYIDVEETCDVPQAIHSIRIENSAIETLLYVNKKECTISNP